MPSSSSHAPQTAHAREGCVVSGRIAVALVGARQAALARAARLGLDWDECQDCAASFVERLLRLPPEVLERSLLAPWADTWLTKCADNCAINALKSRRLLALRQISLDDGAATATIGGSTCPLVLTPSGAVLTDELMARIKASAVLLQPSQQELFARRFVHEEPIEEIARATGRSRDAVRQALSGIRRQVRKHLLACGMDEAEARQYLAELLPRL